MLESEKERTNGDKENSSSSLDHQLFTLSEFEAPTPFSFDKMVSDFKRKQADETHFEKIISEYADTFGITSDGTISTQLNEAAKGIESGFLFVPKSSDSSLSLRHPAQLLDQAATFLQRGLASRGSWDALGAKWMDLSLEIGEYIQLSKLHEEEERAGIYDHDAEMSVGEYNSEQHHFRTQQHVGKNLLEFLETNMSSQLLNNIYRNDRAAGFMGGVPAYVLRGQQASYQVLSHQDNRRGIQLKAGIDHYLHAAESRSSFDLTLRQASWALDAFSYKGRSETAGARLDGLEAKAKWHTRNRDFARRRTQISRDFQDLKSKAATDSEGLLNFEKRREGIKKRFEHDFREAVARIKIAAEGLSTLYGYQEALPDPQNKSTYFDECLLWVRKASSWLISNSHAEQGGIFPISLKALVSDDTWKKLLAGESIKFKISESAFPLMKQIKLRGVSARVVLSTQSHSMWQFSLRAPGLGKMKIGTSELDIQQQDVPMVRLGRVYDVSSQHSPDVAGTVALHNVVPLSGNNDTGWTLQLLGVSPPAEDVLSDLVIEFHVVYLDSSQR